MEYPNIRLDEDCLNYYDLIFLLSVICMNSHASIQTYRHTCTFF
jgi:hypothetical protein